MVMARPCSTLSELPSIGELKNGRTEFPVTNETVSTQITHSMTKTALSQVPSFQRRPSITECDSSHDHVSFIDLSVTSSNNKYEPRNMKVNGHNGTNENLIHLLNETNGISSKETSDCIREISTPYLQDSDEIQVPSYSPVVRCDQVIVG